MKKTASRRKLGEILLAEGCIDERQLAQALGHQKQWKGSTKLGAELIRRGFISEEDLASVLAKQLNIPWLSLHDCAIDYDAVHALDVRLAKRFSVMPVSKEEETFTVATIDPTDLGTLDALRFAVGMQIRPVIATSSDIRWAIARYYDRVGDPAPQATREQEWMEPEDFSPVEEQTVFERLVAVLVDKGILTSQERENILRRER